MQQDQLVSTIEQHLLNTLNNNTAIRQESEKKLFETQTASEFPLFLLQIMRKNENNSNMLDLIASTYFVTYLRNKFKGLSEEQRLSINRDFVTTLISFKHHRVVNELLKGAKIMTSIEFPRCLLLKEALTTLNDQSFGALPNDKKTLILQLIYSLSKEIVQGKAQIAGSKELMQELFGQHLREKSQLLLVDIILFFEQMRTSLVDLVKESSLASNGLHLIKSCVDVSAVSLATWTLKIVALQNRVLPQYHLVTESKVIKLATDLHTIYYQLVMGVMPSSLSESTEVQKFVEDLLYILKRAEKILYQSVEERITTVKDAQQILQYFYDFYFSPNPSVLFFGGKIVDLNNLNQEKYMILLRDSLLIPVIKSGETDLLLQCMKTFTNALEYFGYNDNETLFNQNELSQQATTGATIKSFFLDNFANIINFCTSTLLLMDSEDFWKSNFEAEEYFSEEINRAPDFDLRENAISLIKLIMMYVNEDLIFNHTSVLLQELEKTSGKTLTTVKDVLQKESYYYFLNKLYKDTKNHYEFKDVFTKYMSVDLSVNDQLYDVIKCQIMLYLRTYLQSLYYIDLEEKRFYFLEVCKSLAQENTINTCVSLLALKNLLILFEIDIGLTEYFEQLVDFIIKLMQRTSNVESRMTILNFLEVSLRDNFKGSFEPLWVFAKEFFKLNGESKEFLNVRSKFVDLVSKLVKIDSVLGSDQTGSAPKQGLVLRYLDCCLEIESYSELYLFESGLVLFFHFVSKIRSGNYLPETIATIDVLIQRFEKFIPAKIEHLPSFFLIFIATMNLGSPSTTRFVANNIDSSFEFLIKEVREEATNIVFAAIDYLSLSNKDSFASILHNIIAKGMRCIVEDTQEDNFVLKRNLLAVIARGIYLFGNQFSELSKKIDSTFGINNVLFEFFLKCCEFIPETVYSLQSDKKFCMLLGLFLLRDTLTNIQESQNTLQLGQMSLNAKYSKVEICGTVLKSLVTVSRCYQDTQEKLLYKPEHWISGVVEEALSQDPLLSELTPAEIIRSIELIQQDQLLDFDIISELKEFITGNYDLLIQNKNEHTDVWLEFLRSL